jgi:hypothetical protein
MNQEYSLSSFSLFWSMAAGRTCTEGQPLFSVSVCILNIPFQLFGVQRKSFKRSGLGKNEGVFLVSISVSLCLYDVNMKQPFGYWH